MRRNSERVVTIRDPVHAKLRQTTGCQIDRMVPYPGWRFRYDDQEQAWIHEVDPVKMPDFID